MSINDFERYPLTFGPSPVHQLARLTGTSAARRSGPSGRTATADWPLVATRPASSSTSCRTRSHRAPTRSCRSAATSPTTPGRSRPSPRTSGSSAAWCRRSGWTGTTRSTTRSATSCCRGSWAPTRGSTRTASTSASAPPGRTRCVRSRSPAASPTASRPGRPNTLWADWDSRTGPTRWPQQEEELGVFFDTIVVCTVTGSTHAGMIAGFAALEDAGGRPRRVLGIDASATHRQDPRPGARIAQHTADLIGLGRDAARRRGDRARGLGRRPLRHPGRVDDRGDQAERAARGDDHRPRLRGEVDGRPRRPRHLGRHPGDSTVLYAHLGGQPALNAYSGIFD